MLEASHQVELFDEVFWAEPVQEYGVATMQAPDLPRTVPDALDLLEGVISDSLAAGKFPLTIGGEHSITPGAVRAFLNHYDRITILQFDAHADLRDGYAGEKYSHAAAMRRCLDYPNVELVSVGIRNISAEEISFLEENRDRIKIFWGHEMASWDMTEIANHLRDKKIYITFDVDGFDSSLMPATGTPEPGGMFWHNVMDILKTASREGEIVGADVVELAPAPNLHACDFLTARLCYRILSYALTKQKSAKLR